MNCRHCGRAVVPSISPPGMFLDTIDTSYYCPGGSHDNPNSQLHEVTTTCQHCEQAIQPYGDGFHIDGAGTLYCPGNPPSQLHEPAPDLVEGDESSCTCGYELVWTGEEWQHDAAPWRWGDDHDPDPSPA